MFYDKSVEIINKKDWWFVFFLVMWCDKFIFYWNRICVNYSGFMILYWKDFNGMEKLVINGNIFGFFFNGSFYNKFKKLFIFLYFGN